MSRADAEHFRYIPWCAAVLADTAFAPVPVESRHKKSNAEDRFFSTTLNTPDTVSACHALYRKPSPPSDRVSEVRVLLKVGLGVNGYPNVCHGGFVAVVMDESFGILLHTELEHSGNREERELGIHNSIQGYMTAYMNISYKAPVPTPSVLMVVARYKSSEGRKAYLEARVEDGTGKVLTSADALFVKTRPSEVRL